MTLVPVVLSGGSGTRLWPLSRRRHPKQFLPLVGTRSLFAQTLTRVDALADVTLPVVVGNSEQRVLIDDGLASVQRSALSILLEPVGRNTAPAVAVAALEISRMLGDDALMLVLPSDHLVGNVLAFADAVETARPRAEAGDLLTFGVVPSHPHTGYGYIRAASRDEVAEVEAFVEKPDADTAAQYVASGAYLWNSGMFLFRAASYLQALSQHAPRMLEPCRAALARATTERGATHLDREAFAACEGDSIDYAVMEKTDRATVVRLDAGWSDVGSWDALWSAAPRDGNDNAVAGDVVHVDAHRCHLDARHGTLAVIGVSDLVVVTTEDAVLVVGRADSQRVKELVAAVGEARAGLLDDHPERATVWGHEHSLASVAPGVTRVVLRPAQSVVRHTARTRRAITVQRGRGRLVSVQGARLLTPGESASVPAGTEYRVDNADPTDLVLVEIDAAD